MNLDVSRSKINLCSFADMETSGNVELHIVNTNKFREMRLSFASYPDPETEIYWGIPENIDKEGNVAFRRIVLVGDVIRYNLGNLSEAREWHVIKNSPFVKDSALSKRNGGIDVVYKIFDVNREADIKIKQIRESMTAIDWIDSLDEEKLAGIARIYGLSPETNSIAVIKRALMEKAQKNPESILAKKDKMSDTNLLVALKRAVAMQVVKEVPGIGYQYENRNLGINDNVAVEFLRTNSDIAGAIDQLSREKEKVNKAQAQKNAASKTAPVKSWAPKQPTEPVKDKDEVENFEI